MSEVKCSIFFPLAKPVFSSLFLSAAHSILLFHIVYFWMFIAELLCGLLNLQILAACKITAFWRITFLYGRKKRSITILLEIFKYENVSQLVGILFPLYLSIYLTNNLSPSPFIAMSFSFLGFCAFMPLQYIPLLLLFPFVFRQCQNDIRNVRNRLWPTKRSWNLRIRRTITWNWSLRFILKMYSVLTHN